MHHFNRINTLSGLTMHFFPTYESIPLKNVPNTSYLVHVTLKVEAPISKVITSPLGLDMLHHQFFFAIHSLQMNKKQVHYGSQVFLVPDKYDIINRFQYYKLYCYAFPRRIKSKL